jgi:tRNA (guanine37-N1)-methyltransferase
MPFRENVEKVLGNADSLDVESYENNLLEVPPFAKPEIFQKLSVVKKEFLKGNHSKISDLKFRCPIVRQNIIDLIRKNDEK